MLGIHIIIYYFKENVLLLWLWYVCNLYKRYEDLRNLLWNSMTYLKNYVLSLDDKKEDVMHVEKFYNENFI